MVRGNRSLLRGIVLSLWVMAMTDPGIAQESLFTTWEGFEADKCASIWLIQRFIAPQAEIRFQPRGTSINEGIPFDTPDARFRRYHNKSTYETLFDHYGLRDESLAYIGRLIHDIEVNIWERKVMPETPRVESDMQRVLAHSEPDKILEACRTYFDRLYKTKRDGERK